MKYPRVYYVAASHTTPLEYPCGWFVAISADHDPIGPFETKELALEFIDDRGVPEETYD